MTQLARQLIRALKISLETGRAPTIPEAGRDLWQIFIALSCGRTYHIAGPNPIAVSEIEAYARLYRWPLQPHHIDTIRALDDTWLSQVHSKNGESKSGATLRRPSAGQAINPAVFDAVFG